VKGLCFLDVVRGCAPIVIEFTTNFFRPNASNRYDADSSQFLLFPNACPQTLHKIPQNPIYPPTSVTFGFPIYNSLADKLGAVELVVWDKDMLKNIWRFTAG
jgi:hypothetical protein